MENSAVEQWSGNVEKHSRWKKTKRKPDDETKEGETKKKKRPFNEKWTAGGEWLVYDPWENVMYCTDCMTVTK